MQFLFTIRSALTELENTLTSCLLVMMVSAVFIAYNSAVKMDDIGGRDALCSVTDTALDG